jgi:glutathione S-transferase
MKLLGVDASPYVRKIRIVLEEKHIPYEYVQARPSPPDSPVPQFNPLAKIPVLVTDKGKGIYDSPVIVDYLEMLVAEPRLIPTEPEARIDVKRWEALADGVTDATVAISHERRKPHDRQENAEWYKKQRLKIDRGLAAMEQALGKAEFCYANRFSLADIATGYTLGYIDSVLPEIDWRLSHSNLARLVERLGKRDSFRKTALSA